MSIQKFHSHHGKNIILLENETVAFRELSFAHGITFSEQALHPMELFLIEIDKNERGWSGYLRIGLTQIDPNDSFDIPLYALPDLANFSNKKSWIFAVTAMHNKFGEMRGSGDHNPSSSTISQPSNTSSSSSSSSPHRAPEMGGGDGDRSPRETTSHNFIGDNEFVYTYQGHISKQILRNLPKQKSSTSSQDWMKGEEEEEEEEEKRETEREREGTREGRGRGGGGGESNSNTIRETRNISNQQLTSSTNPISYPTTPFFTPSLTTASSDHYSNPFNNILPTDVGSRLGIMYIIKGGEAEMHFILNGEDVGAWAKGIPYKEHPLRAVVDVYGTTKQVRIIQLNCVSTLQNACRRVILKWVEPNKINKLPVPISIKDYLQFHFH